MVDTHLKPPAPPVPPAAPPSLPLPRASTVAPEQETTLTARRRAEPQAPSSAAKAERADEEARFQLGEAADSIVVTSGASNAKATTRRGDWNACTVNDPARDLRRCRQARSISGKGDSARAATALADGLAVAWRGDFERAVDAFDRAIEDAPRNGFAYLNRGLAHYRLGNLDRAKADLDQAVRFGGSARAYYNRSLVLKTKGERKAARRDEERAIELDPAYADVID